MRILRIVSYVSGLVFEWNFISRVMSIISMSDIRLVMIEVSMWFYSIVEWVIGMDWNCLKILFEMLVNSWKVV